MKAFSIFSPKTVGGWNIFILFNFSCELVGLVVLVSVEMRITLHVKVAIVIVPLFLLATVVRHSISYFAVAASCALNLSNGLQNS